MLCKWMGMIWKGHWVVWSGGCRIQMRHPLFFLWKGSFPSPPLYSLQLCLSTLSLSFSPSFFPSLHISSLIVYLCFSCPPSSPPPFQNLLILAYSLSLSLFPFLFVSIPPGLFLRFPSEAITGWCGIRESTRSLANYSPGQLDKHVIPFPPHFLLSIQHTHSHAIWD